MAEQLRISYDEAAALPPDQRVQGLIVDGNVTPFGGSWVFVVLTGTLLLTQPPTLPDE